MASPWSMGRGQNEVAARVVAAGAGKKLKSGASPRSIARAVRQVLDDPSYREAAVRMAAAIAKEAVEDRALVELEALADGSREPVRA